jgi:hypothetical protein
MALTSAPDLSDDAATNAVPIAFLSENENE